MLYVLDEPSVGLHPRDIDRLIGAIRSLRDRGNTVVVVEHEEAMIRAADQVVEIGPGAGERGGEVVFQGTPDEMLSSPRQPHRRLSCRAGAASAAGRSAARRTTAGFAWPGRAATICKNVTVEFPLGVLCLVTGVSGSGKSTLVQDTLYPALCRRMRKDAPKPYRLRRRVRRRPDRRRDPGRSKPDRPLAALATRSPTSRRSTRFAPCSPKRSKPARATTTPAISASTSTAAAAAACQGDGYIADRHAVSGRRVHEVRPVRRHALSQGDSRRQVSRPQHRRRAGHDRPRGVHVLSRPAESAGPAEAADRRGARLLAARPAGQHALGRRGPAAQAGRLHVGHARAAGRCSSSTSRPPACTFPTSCNCSIASTPCSTWGIR